ncbi:MAG: metallopeptidase family protein [Deltaproteobacteria bacterium]|nr:metallopeptidase family protein [Deltaproteobacteria bacterium]
MRAAVESLPDELKSHIENVAVLVEEEFIPGSLEEVDEGQEYLGFYHGISQKDRGFWYGNVLPDRIIIYRNPLERMSRDLADLKENIRQTVIHEVGHYFGLNEEELAELEGRGP